MQTAGEYNEPHRLVPTVGDLTPSSADLEITQRMKRAGDLLGIAVSDRVIVLDTDHISLKADSPIW
jgi:DNA repair protein RadC